MLSLPDIDVLRGAQALRILTVLGRHQVELCCGPAADGSWWARVGETGHVYRGADLQDALGQLTNVLSMEETEAVDPNDCGRCLGAGDVNDGKHVCPVCHGSGLSSAGDARLGAREARRALRTETPRLAVTSVGPYTELDYTDPVEE